MNAVPYYTRSIVLMLAGLLLSTAAFALLNTAVPLWLEERGVLPGSVGIVGTLFFAGTMAGTLTAALFVRRFGFNRCYQTACVLCALAALGLLAAHHWLLWGGLRFGMGVGSAWIWVVVESALLRIGSVKTRGVLLAAYMAVYYGGSVLGQLVLGLAPESMPLLAGIAVTGTLAAMVPFFLLRLPEPRRERGEGRHWGALLGARSARLGVAGCVIAGIALGILYAVLPLYLKHAGIRDGKVGFWMAALIGAGILGQWPAGKLAGAWSREAVLRLLACLTVAACAGMMALEASLLLPCVALLGASVFAMYPVAMAWGCETAPRGELVTMNQIMLFVFAIGSMGGPLLAGALMERYSDRWLPGSVALAVFAYLLLMLAVRPARRGRPVFAAAQRGGRGEGMTRYFSLARRGGKVYHGNRSCGKSLQ